MVELIKKHTKKILTVLGILSILFVMFSFVNAFHVLHSIETHPIWHTQKQLQETDWKVTNENDSTFLTYRGDLNDLKGKVLFFDNNRQGVIVKVNDQIVHQVNTTSLIKQIRFTDYIILQLPYGLISVEIEVVPYDENYEIPTIYAGELFEAQYYVLHGDIFTAFLLFLFLIIGCMIIFLILYLSIKNAIDYRLYSLFVFLILSMFWGATDSYLPVLFNIPQEIVGFVCYFSFMALPIPISYFVWQSVKGRNSFLPIIMGLELLNLILQSILSYVGLINLQYTVYVTHVFVLALIVESFLTFLRQRKENPDNHEQNILFASVIVLSAFTAIALLLYWQKGSMYYRNCLLIGIFIFLILLMASIVARFAHLITRQQQEMTEMAMYERFSLYDELTGLMNRRAFEKKLEDIQNRMNEIEDAILIMFDVNGLKHTNDTYGHVAGDDLIVSAAKAIQSVYGEIGTCYRIGGDEFVVISEHDFSTATYEEALDETIEINNEHSKWKLSIARGTSHLLRTTGKIISISDWKQEADIKMYRNKVSMTTKHSRNRAKDLQSIIECIISTVEARDIYTASHSERVRELSLRIADRLGVSTNTREYIEVAAHLHDIGKVGIPDYILLKDSSLTDEEYKIMKQHTVLGADIISKAQGMYEISRIVLHHHERYDGKGYPSGIKGDEIPLESRIIAIADSIDAMTSPRVYRSALSIDDCKDEIIRNSGKMYDPAMVQIVLDNWKEIEDVILLHPKHLIKGDGN